VQKRCPSHRRGKAQSDEDPARNGGYEHRELSYVLWISHSSFVACLVIVEGDTVLSNETRPDHHGAVHCRV